MPRPSKCRGVIASDDPSHPPLARCKESALDGGDYCELHRSQAERQNTLRRYLKPGWAQALVARRGRPPSPEHLPSVEEAVEQMKKRRAPELPLSTVDKVEKVFDPMDPAQRAALLRGDS